MSSSADDREENFEEVLRKLADGDGPTRDLTSRARALLEFTESDQGAGHAIADEVEAGLLVLIALNGVSDASAAAEVSERELRGILTRCEARAAAVGWSPPHAWWRGAPPGYFTKFRTQNLDGEGNLKSEWVRQQRDGSADGGEPGEDFAVSKISQQRTGDGKLLTQWRSYSPDKMAQAEKMEQAMAALAEPLRGLAEPSTPPADRSADHLMACYVMGDPHLGMYAWGAETGFENHDLEKGERELVTAMRWLAKDVCSHARPKRAMVVNLGDFFHADNSDNETLRGKHKLDVDGRYGKVVDAGVRAFRTMIDIALEHHDEVVVENVPGNHDVHSAYWLAVALKLLYENDPRVEIVASPSIYRWHTFGNVLIGLGHGEHAKPKDLGAIMSVRHPDWRNGQDQTRVFYRGHHHTSDVVEASTVKVECFQILAPPDAYAATRWDSGRSMAGIVHHRDHGEIRRHYCGISMVRELQGAA